MCIRDRTQAELEKLVLQQGFQDLRAEAADLFLEAILQRELLEVQKSSYEYMYQLSQSDSLRSVSYTHLFPWGYGEFPIMWDGDVSANIPAYKEQFEVCPPGYRRPTDGYTDKISYNGYYDYLPDEGTTGTATNLSLIHI